MWFEMVAFGGWSLDGEGGYLIGLLGRPVWGLALVF